MRNHAKIEKIAYFLFLRWRLLIFYANCSWDTIATADPYPFSAAISIPIPKNCIPRWPKRKRWGRKVAAQPHSLPLPFSECYILYARVWLVNFPCRTLRGAWLSSRSLTSGTPTPPAPVPHPSSVLTVRRSAHLVRLFIQNIWNGVHIRISPEIKPGREKRSTFPPWIWDKFAAIFV